jgi:hypothetical protein
LHYSSVNRCAARREELGPYALRSDMTGDVTDRPDDPMLARASSGKSFGSGPQQATSPGELRRERYGNGQQCDNADSLANTGDPGCRG